MSPKKSKNTLNEQLYDLLRQFWEVEVSFDPLVKVNKEDIDCETYFVNHHIRLDAGAYSVHVPMKHNIKLLGESLERK